MRRAVLACLVIFFLACLVIFFIVASVRAAGNVKVLPPIPDVGEPFDVRKFCTVSVPYGQNALMAYRHAAALAVSAYEVLNRAHPAGGAVDWKPYFKSVNDTLDKGWQFANDDVRRWVAANEVALEAWRRGTECADSLDLPMDGIGKVPPNFSLLDVLRPREFYQPAREFAKLACLQGAQLRAGRRPADAWIWYRATLRSSAHCGMHSILTGRLVGLSIFSLAADATRQWAARLDISARDLRVALADVLVVNSMTPPPSDSFKCDYLWWSEGTYIESAIDIVIPRLGPYLEYFGYRERARRILNLVYANLLSQADWPQYRRAPISGRLGLFASDPATPRASTVYSDEIIEQQFLVFPPEIKIAQYLLPPKAVFDVIDSERAQQSALVLGLALQLHYREHGEFPATLDELVKNGYLKAIPVDPFGQGEPFHYRREASRHEGAVLWSVAKDGIDQQGKLDILRDHSDGTGDRIYKIAVPR